MEQTNPPQANSKTSIYQFSVALFEFTNIGVRAVNNL